MYVELLAANIGVLILCRGGPTTSGATVTATDRRWYRDKATLDRAEPGDFYGFIMSKINLVVFIVAMLVAQTYAGDISKLREQFGEFVKQFITMACAVPGASEFFDTIPEVFFQTLNVKQPACAEVGVSTKHLH
uniref:Uncharacterized protein n=1 Tax=Strigamia maritima TaxID=126957 RepID=T1IT62_STRMM